MQSWASREENLGYRDTLSYYKPLILKHRINGGNILINLYNVSQIPLTQISRFLQNH